MRTVAWLAFLLAGSYFVYVLLIYPLVLYVMARRVPVRTRRELKPQPVTILIPVHNGARWIEQKLHSVLALNYPRDLVRMIVLSDGSTDRTEAIAQHFADRGVELVRLPKGGKPQAINAGLQLADSELVFLTDVRQKLDPDCLIRLVENFADTDVGAVCGELIILDGDSQEEQSVGLYWKIEKWIRKQLTRAGTLLVVTGCIYVVRRDLAEPLPKDVLGDDIFIPQAVLRKGYRVMFEENARAYDYPTSRDVEFHRKVRTLAGLFQFVRNHGLGPHPFHFFSYKVSRLFLPYALIIIAVSSLFLHPAAAIPAVLAQAVLYTLAAADDWIPERNLLKRISSPARTFCMLMAAAFCSASVLFRPASDLWKTTQVRTPKVHRQA